MEGENSPNSKRQSNRLRSKQSNSLENVSNHLEFEDHLKKNDLNENVYQLKLIGGQKLTKVRPVFTENNHILIPYEQTINLFSLQNGQISRTISSKDFSSENSFRVVNVCLHPFMSSFQFYSFCTNGQIVQWNYLDGTFTCKYNLFFNEIQSETEPELVWATAKNLNLFGENNVIFYYAVKIKKKSETFYQVYAAPQNNLNKCELFIEMDVFNEQRISFGPNNDYVVFLTKDNLYFLSLSQGFKNENQDTPISIHKRKNDKKNSQLRIVTCSPTENCIVYTGENGIIIFLHINPLNPSEEFTKTAQHWHSMPITDLGFSANGTYLYSVGYETVVLRWNVKTFEKNFISRVGFAIKFIACDSTNTNLAITLQNNQVKIIGSHFDGLNLDLNSLAYLENQEFFTGIVYNSKNKAIVTNGRPGYLQFYSPFKQKVLFNLDVTNTNYIQITNPPTNVANIDVYKIAISPCANWLATFEMRDDNVTLIETRLKFWQLNKLEKVQNNKEQSSEKYNLHNCIHLPHKNRINEMRFTPNSKLMISTSIDKTFKVWNIKNSETYWICIFTYNFNSHLFPKQIAISNDSSMLAIDYDSTIALFNIKDEKKISYIDSLPIKTDDNTDITNKQSFLNIEFGTGIMSHLFVAGTHENLIVWDLSVSKIKWIWKADQNVKIQNITFDKCSNIIALVTNDQTFYIFNINTSKNEPLYKVTFEKILGENITNLIFIPKDDETKSKYFDKVFGFSSLCFLTDQKQLYLVENKEIEEKIKIDKQNIQVLNLEKTNKKILKSPLVQELINRKARLLSGENKLEKKTLDINLFSKHYSSSRLVDEMFYNVPSHVLPPIEIISKAFLTSLLKSKSSVFDEDIINTQKIIDIDEQTEMDVDQNENKTGQINLKIKESNIENKLEEDELFKNIKLAKNFTFNENYSFLSNK